MKGTNFKTENFCNMNYGLTKNMQKIIVQPYMFNLEQQIHFAAIKYTLP